MRTKAVRLIATALLAALTAGFAWLSWTRSQLPYDEQGRYFDAAAGVVNDEGAALVYAMIALALGAITLSAAWFGHRK